MNISAPQRATALGQLNRESAALVESILRRRETLRIATHQIDGGGRVLDFGLQTPGGLEAGIELARVCLAGRGDVRLVPAQDDFPTGLDVVVRTDQPVLACLGAQYAGWALKFDDFFAMGSGAVRALARVEPLFEELDFPEEDPTAGGFGVLESSEMPTAAVFARMAERCGIPVGDLTLLVAPTSSPAGMLQIVARSVETAMHQLHELQFDLDRVLSGFGAAPLPPCGGSGMTALGRSNDAILYGSRVTLWVRGDDDSLAEVGPRMVSSASSDYGRPFLDIFQQHGGDFYQIDPKLFAPAVVRLINVDSGRMHTFGNAAPELCMKSFLG